LPTAGRQAFGEKLLIGFEFDQDFFHRIDDRPNLIARDNDPHIIILVPVATSADNHVAIGVRVDR
jgi:glutamine synthetase type III